MILVLEFIHSFFLISELSFFLWSSLSSKYQVTTSLASRESGHDIIINPVAFRDGEDFILTPRVQQHEGVRITLSKNIKTLSHAKCGGGNTIKQLN